MALFLIAIAIAIRSVNYEVTREILLRDIDTQLWTRLDAFKTRQRFAPETLLGPDLAFTELALPDLRTASDLKPSVAMRLLIPSAVSGRPFPWFAGAWREDGSLLAALRLPEGIAQGEPWRDSLETIRTTPDGKARLAACRGSDGTVLLVGTPLEPLAQAMREVLWFYVWTVALAIPPMALAMWWILSRMMLPLSRISRTAATIAAGDFAARIDLAQADSELVSMATTLNGMLDRLEAIRISQARFNADVAHEILNPIHGILLQADLAQQRPRTTDELTRTIEHCRALALRIQKLSEALLALSKAESTADGALARLDLEPIVEEAATQVEDLARARHVTLQVDSRSDLVVGNADLLHQVFVNLLANGIEYSPVGGAVELVMARAGERVVVRVTDHGEGIPADRAEQVFERFFREDPSRVTTTGGHGLGLAICRSIVRGHGGDVTCRPTPGGGATFEVQFPAASLSPRQAAKDGPDGPAPAALSGAASLDSETLSILEETRREWAGALSRRVS
jgi:signal transduction histidine kinase